MKCTYGIEYKPAQEYAEQITLESMLADCIRCPCEQCKALAIAMLHGGSGRMSLELLQRLHHPHLKSRAAEYAVLAKIKAWT